MRDESILKKSAKLPFKRKSARCCVSKYLESTEISCMSIVVEEATAVMRTENFSFKDLSKHILHAPREQPVWRKIKVETKNLSCLT